MIKSLFGTKAFYKKVIYLLIPILIQNGITNFVSMLDNIMIGNVDTAQMTGVAVANQLIFVFNLCIFGAISGAGIFGAQFFGSNNHKGVRDTFRFKIIFCGLLSVIGIAVLYFFGDELIMLYLKGDASAGESAEVILGYARKYLNIMLIGILPYTLTQCYASTLRETGKSVPPMLAGLLAVGVNLSLNFVLIFGMLGFPALGAAGAAIATVISRFAEVISLSLWTSVRRDINKFIVGAYRSLRVPIKLVWDIILKGAPLMVNETLWALGVATLNQCYSTEGLAVVAANNISQTFFNVFSVAIMAVGTAIGIVLGQQLGSGDTDGAMDTAKKLITFSVLVAAAISVIYIILAEFIPLIYKTEPEVRALATGLMVISALAFPLDAFASSTYFTLRSGGKSAITFIFDSCFMWVVSVPCAYFLTSSTELGILPIFAIVQALNLLKCIMGFILVKSGKWIRKLA